MPNLNFNQFSFNAFLNLSTSLLKSGVESILERPTIGGGGLPGTSPGGVQVGQNRLALSALFKNDSMQLNPQEMATFLKDALKLPGEVKMLLLLLALEASPGTIKPNVQKPLKQLITQNLGSLQVSAEDLQKLLGKNTKEAQDMLFKLIQGNQTSQTKSAQQLADVLTSLGKLGEKIKASPAQALETLLILYIPWYPLAAQQKLEMYFEPGEGGEEGDNKEVIFTIYIETNTLGRFKLVVQEHDPLQVEATVFHEEIAQSLIPELEAHINDSLADEGLPTALFTSKLIHPDQQPELLSSNQTQNVTSAMQSNERESPINPVSKEPKGFQDATRQSDHKKISVQAGKQVSLLVINTAYTMARFLFEADERFRLLQKRKNKVSKPTKP